MVTISDVIVKPVPAVRVLGLRAKLESFREQGRLWQSINIFASTYGFVANGPKFTVHYSCGSEGSEEVEVEVCIPINEDAELPDECDKQFTIQTLPELPRVASATLFGSCEQLPQLYTKILDWMAANDKQRAGLTREIYLNMDTADPMGEDFQSEVQVPLQ